MRSLAQFSGSVAFQEPSVSGAQGIWSLEDAMGFQALGQWPVWTPPVVFASGEQGFLLDLSDLTTLFQGVHVTNPVTASGQTVGLALDQHLWGGKTLDQALADQPELIPSPLTGTPSGTWAVGATAVTRNGSATGQASLNLSGGSLDTAKRYQITFTVADFSGDAFGIRFPSGAAIGPIAANGTHTYLLSPMSSTTSLVFTPWADTVGQATISNISVKRIPGNHASQATVAARPAFRDIGGVRYLESDGVDDALNITLPSGTYTRAYVNAAGVMTIDEAVAISGTENIMREQTIAGIVYIDRALTDSEKARLAAYWGAAS